MTSREDFRFVGAGQVTIVGTAFGPADGLPVILSHGGGQTRHAWGRTASLLGDAGFRVVSLDLRGHGDSDWARAGAGYPIDDYVNDLHRAMAILQRPAVLVGASLGGIASLIAAGEAPFPRIAGLCLVDVSPHLRGEGVAGILYFMRSTIGGFDTVADAAAAIANYLPHRPPPSDLRGLEKNLRRDQDGRYRWHWDPATIAPPLDPVRMNPRIEQAAGKVSAPALLLRGELSELVMADVATAFMRRFADGRVQDIVGARHMVAGDANDPFGDALLAFANSVRRGEPIVHG